MCNSSPSILGIPFLNFAKSSKDTKPRPNTRTLELSHTAFSMKTDKLFYKIFYKILSNYLFYISFSLIIFDGIPDNTGAYFDTAHFEIYKFCRPTSRLILKICIQYKSRRSTCLNLLILLHNIYKTFQKKIPLTYATTYSYHKTDWIYWIRENCRKKSFVLSDADLLNLSKVSPSNDEIN